MRAAFFLTALSPREFRRATEPGSFIRITSLSFDLYILGEIALFKWSMLQIHGYVYCSDMLQNAGEYGI